LAKKYRKFSKIIQISSQKINNIIILASEAVDLSSNNEKSEEKSDKVEVKNFESRKREIYRLKRIEKEVFCENIKPN
jgi:hypothetical protein